MLMRFPFAFVVIFAPYLCSHAWEVVQNISPSKRMMVGDIIKKVSSLTLNYLSKTPTFEKGNVLNRIENRLKNTARSMGFDGDKYLELIMKGVKIRTFNDSEQSLSDEIENSTQNAVIKLQNTSLITRTEDGHRTKKEIIHDIARKLEVLSKDYLQNAKTLEEKKNVLEAIKNKVIETAQKTHMEIHDRHANIKTYKDLIAQGLELMVQRRLSEGRDIRRSFIDLDDIEVDMPNNDNLLDSNLGPSEVTMKNDSSYDLCKIVLDETCLLIQSLNKLTCYNGKNVPIEKLCNGISDCSDGSDEVNCTGVVLEKLRNANNLISEVEKSLAHKCIKQRVAETIISPQNEVLRDVLNKQFEFLEKYITETNLTTNVKKIRRTDTTFLKIINNAALVLGTLAIAFQGTLCVPDYEINLKSITELVKDIDGDVTDRWSPKSCSCKGPYCLGAECVSPCRRVCWQKHSLSQWECQASNGGLSVSMDVICDGKLDCFDEADESKCASGTSYSKFESIEMYKQVIDMILEKTKLKEYQSCRNNLLTLLGFVKQLQKITFGLHIDAQAVKLLRGQTFETLIKIYDDLSQVLTLQGLDDAYLFLRDVNDKLINAMKHSHTGNDVILNPGECYCRNGQCVLRKCSKKCIRACIAEPRLTRFVCSNTGGNTSVAIDEVCNNINDCPNADDEIGCNKEICRPHHLVVLRHDLRAIGESKKGTALGEVLVAWRTKVLAALIIAENKHRITPKIILDVVTSMLRDLVLAYSKLEEKGPNTDYILKEFEKTSKIVLNALKSCGK